HLSFAGRSTTSSRNTPRSSRRHVRSPLTPSRVRDARGILDVGRSGTSSAQGAGEESVMLRWESYRAVYGAELRAAALEYSDHGWPVIGACSAGLLLATGTALDVIEVPAAVGRQVCAQLREAGLVVPVAATPTGRWWFPVTPGVVLPASLRERADVVLHTDGAAVLAPPSETPDGWVHWRVAPALSGYRPSPSGPIVAAVTAAVEVYEGARLPVAAAAR